MDLRDLGFVGCRLLALYFGIQALHLAPTVLEALALQVTTVAAEGPNVWLLSLSQVIGFAIWVCAGVALWKYAHAISSLVAPSGRAHLTTPASRDDIQQVLFAAVGLFILIHAAGDLAETIYIRYTLKSQGLEPPRFVDQTGHALVAAAKVLIGLFLVFGSSGLVGAIKRFRETGRPSNNRLERTAGDAP